MLQGKKVVFGKGTKRGVSTTYRRKIAISGAVGGLVWILDHECGRIQRCAIAAKKSKWFRSTV